MKINENLVLYSTTKQIRNTYLAGYYSMSEDLVKGETYTISFEGEWSGGNLAIFIQDGYVLVDSNPEYKKIGGRYFYTFELKYLNGKRGKENIISFYNYPDDGKRKTSEIYHVKLEKGKEATLYIPNKADLKDSSFYPDKVGRVSNGRKYVPFRGCGLC